ncbi:lantibiotic dehydratase [Streptomyces sp. PT12]|uniref:lantibiotic dehydratase n=1 Tax=Streptomyces sp. PT12 TaxID=1510197 RepID=UPI000DE1E74F|nr:lantibiotic dehydratase [Streptomyces sp. PT12]RBM14154.1 lantibiotic dehydratase [Streptomyces sp. PT12]
MKPLYRHTGVALLRAAASPLNQTAASWPDVGSEDSCREWLEQTWSRPGLPEAIRQASVTLADRVEAALSGANTSAKQLRRATLATVRYLLRATGRPTPFGLFAGVSPVELAPTARVRWGREHRSVARVDTEWLASVAATLESQLLLLERLDVVFNNLAVRRGARLQVPHGGPRRASIRYTDAVRTVRQIAATRVRFGSLADRVAAAFPGTDRARAVSMLTELVQRGFLISGLRAPLTETDPLGHLVERLREAGANTVPGAGRLLENLEAIQADVHQHNHEALPGEQARLRGTITRRMRGLSTAGRTLLAVDLLLDCEVHLPRGVALELERAATALLLLSRQPTGQAVWKDFHVAFWERYGTGTLVPLTDVVDPASGLGFPAEYPGSLLVSPQPWPNERDERLLALAWRAAVNGEHEIVLTDELLARLADVEKIDEWCLPPHVEISARVHAASTEALQRGAYTLTVTPARSAGTLTSRFTPAAVGSGLGEVYRSVPTLTAGALPVQLSFPPIYPHTENVCRIPVYLHDVISLGEHRHADRVNAVPLDDLAVTATRNSLYLVSVSRRRVVEPQVFHAMALEKQPPPLARFLAHLPRAFTAAWTGFDWGPHASRLPCLPRVRYRRTVLSPCRWQLTGADLPDETADEDTWRQALDEWRQRWRCPGTVELHDDDRALRLTLDEPTHAAILRAHLRRKARAVLTETSASADEWGWLNGHVHEIALPLVTTRQPAPSPLGGLLPRLTNAHRRPPGFLGARWLNAKVHTHPECFDEIIAEHLPRLLAALPGDPAYWFVRYRSPFETDHLRLRIRASEAEDSDAQVAAVAEWANGLRDAKVAGELVLDSYGPEIGRYGDGAAMEAAEAAFVADSRTVAAALRHPSARAVPATALVAMGMTAITRGFLGSHDGMGWLATRPVPAAAVVDRAVKDQALDLSLKELPDPLLRGAAELGQAWQRRAAALASYRESLPEDADVDAVLESLLHMHHNRAVGMDREDEKACRALARQVAVAWRARRGDDDR